MRFGPSIAEFMTPAAIAALQPISIGDDVVPNWLARAARHFDDEGGVVVDVWTQDEEPNGEGRSALVRSPGRPDRWWGCEWLERRADRINQETRRRYETTDVGGRPRQVIARSILAPPADDGREH